MPAFIARMVMTVLRHVLTGIGLSLVSDGWLTSDQSQQVVGALMTLFGTAWAIYQARKDHKNQVAAQSNDLAGAMIPTTLVVNGGPLPPVSK